MSERLLRPLHVATAAVVLGGLLLVLFPQGAPTILRLVLVAGACAAALHALTAHGPPTWWRSPFDRQPVPGRQRTSDHAAWIRTALGRRRQRIARGIAVPPDVIRLVQPLLRAELDRHAGSGRGIDTVTLLSPESQALLTARPLPRPTWLRTLRPDRRRSARIVDTVLDDVERLARSGRRLPSTPAPARRS